MLAGITLFFLFECFVYSLNGYDCVLDIYKEQKSFRKTSPGSPDCVVVVVR